VSVHLDHFKYTAFITHEGKNEWLRMPVCLKNASSTPQRLMDDALGCALFSQAYLDTWEEHVKHFRDTFFKVATYRIRLKRLKCIFDAKYPKTLGHVVGPNGDCCFPPDQENVATILCLPLEMFLPQRSVLGPTGYYLGYVGNFAQITESLSHMMKKTSSFAWTPLCQYAFDEVKRCLSFESVLRAPNFKLPLF
jgi:hypothetical protein